MDGQPPRKTLGLHMRNRLISGLFVLVPLWVTVVVAGMILRAMAAFVQPLVELLPWAMPPGGTAAISLLAFVLLVYLAGAITTHMIGRRLVALGEALILRIPIIRNIYSASKQVVDALSLSNRSTFKSVALIEYPRPGIKALGFVTGYIKDGEGRTFCRVFVPTTPNPTSGFLELVPCDQVETTDLTVEEGIKLIVSGGVIGPDVIRGRRLPGPP
jgi:uncharacterized membrane protein